MLKICQHNNANRLIRYFDEDFVYDGDELDPLRREQIRGAAGLMPSWHGKASEFLQLPEVVTKAAFTTLAKNLHPLTKEQLTPRMRIDRIVAYDLTFSLPKGVSLLYAIGGHREVSHASKRAIASTMAEAEHLMRVRVRDGGPKDDRLTKNLTGEYVGIGASVLYSAYETWATENGIYKKLGAKGFRDRLTRLGFGQKRTNAARMVTGIGLKVTDTSRHPSLYPKIETEEFYI